MATGALYLIALAVVAPSSAAAQPTPGVVLRLSIHVAEVDAVPVVTPEFVAERVARANQIFAPYGVGFTLGERQTLPARHAAQQTRADRDALAEFWRPDGAIHVFVVASLLDVDEPGRVRRGVHWHARSSGGRHYVILSAIAGLNVLAHELGHFLGNRDHSQVPGNLMSYEHFADVLPVLDARQSARLSRALTGYLRSRELQARSPTDPDRPSRDRRALDPSR